jgi:hypothetical protein
MPAPLPPPSNPPERASLKYRLGTRTDFLRWMLEQLREQTIPDGPNAGTRPLSDLATHSPSDPTVALLDAFASLGDVLTFYQERIANEGFLRTATEVRSLLELGRSLGYELGPGLAAATRLAFAVDEAAGGPAEVVVAPGVRVQSVPGQDEMPQTFETIERIAARPEWNELLPVTANTQAFDPSAPELWVELRQANVSPGDMLLFVSNARSTDTSAAWALRTVASVTAFPAAKSARIGLVPVSGGAGPVSGGGHVFSMNQRAAAFGYNAPSFAAMPASVQTAYGSGTDWANFSVTLTADARLFLDSLYPQILPGTWLVLTANTQVELYWVSAVENVGHSDFTLTARCTAPQLRAKPDATSAPSVSDFTSERRGLVVLGQGPELRMVDRPLADEVTWGAAILTPFPAVLPVPSPDDIDKAALDRVVLGLVPGRTLIVNGKRLRARVLAAGGIELLASNGVTTTHVAGDVLYVVSRPVPSQTAGLTTWHLVDTAGFEGTADLVDESLALEPAQAFDPVFAEVATLKEVIQSPVRSTLHFSAPLAGIYDRATVTISANVATATHGQTVREALGSGDGGQANQRFTLSRSPLTWLSAATTTGRQSTLQIWVDGTLWHGVSSLYDQAPNARIYVTRRDEQGRTTVVFGDGVHGARLPSGQENVVAQYRIGTGEAGAVAAGKLSLFQTRPLGLRAVKNPLAATGGEDPDDGSVAKTGIPASVLTLDRVVSVEDYATFAGNFAGIGKARATLLRRGETQRVLLTLALADGTPVPRDAVILDNLRAALDGVRDTTTRVDMAGYRRIWFRAAAKLRVSPDRRFSDVAAAAADAMRQAFSFAARSFGQGVSAAEVIALLQGVSGAEAVDLDGLALEVDLGDQHVPDAVEAWLPAEDAQVGTEVLAAELLLLDPSPLGLTLKNAEETP